MSELMAPDWQSQTQNGYDRVVARVREQPRLSILELGTRRIEGKPATIRRGLAHPSSRYVGTDFQAGDDVDIVADAHCLSATFGCRSFDVVLAFSVYEHLKRPWLVTNEIAKILKPSGWAFLQTHQSFPLHAFPDDYFRFSCDALRVLCEDAGLSVLDLGHAFEAKIFSDREPGLENGPAFLNSWILAERTSQHVATSDRLTFSAQAKGRDQAHKKAPGDRDSVTSIAAILPLYNGQRWIAQSLQSIFEQTRAPDEIIVVDDGSTDDGPAIVRRIAKQHPVRLVHKQNGGQSSARNFGVAHCRSRLIALIDQDDAWYPTHLEELERAYRKHRGGTLGWAYSNLDQIDENGLMVCRSFLNTLKSLHPKLDVFSCLEQDMFILPSASLIDKDAFEAVGGFDEQLCGYEDDDLFLRLFRAGYSSTYVNKPLSKWRIHPSSTSYTYQMGRSRVAYAAKLLKAFPDNVEQNRYFARDLIAPRFISNIIADFNKALQKNDKDMYQNSVADLKFLHRYLRLRQRVVWRLILVLLSYYPIGYAARQVTKLSAIVRVLIGMTLHPLRTLRIGLYRA